jgi:hypothetical protein
MKSRFMVLALSLVAFIPRFVVGQTTQAPRGNAGEEPSPYLLVHAFANTSQPNWIIARLIEFQPVIPMGPNDVLKAYEDGMTLTAQRLSDELMSITQANRSNQITRDEAEHLILDRYQVAMMQHATLAALRDSLEHDIAQVTKRQDTVGRPDTPTVVQPPSSPLVRYQ